MTKTLDLDPDPDPGEGEEGVAPGGKLGPEGLGWEVQGSHAPQPRPRRALGV